MTTKTTQRVLTCQSLTQQEIQLSLLFLSSTGVKMALAFHVQAKKNNSSGL
jgi:hypothetical protein